MKKGLEREIFSLSRTETLRVSSVLETHEVLCWVEQVVLKNKKIHDIIIKEKNMEKLEFESESLSYIEIEDKITDFLWN